MTDKHWDLVATASQDPDVRRMQAAVGRQFAGRLSPDEIHDACLDALMRSAASYDPSRGQQFPSSIVRFTRWECTRALRRRRGALVRVPFPEDLATQDDRDVIEELEDRMAPLGKLEQEMLMRHYIRGETQIEIANALGVERRTVRRWLSEAPARCIQPGVYPSSSRRPSKWRSRRSTPPSPPSTDSASPTPAAD